jgi:hypothetical protein
MLPPGRHAVPVERARETLTRDVLRLDPSLRRLDDLVTDWMVGIQYYLREQLFWAGLTNALDLG